MSYMYSLLCPLRFVGKALNIRPSARYL